MSNNETVTRRRNGPHKDRADKPRPAGECDNPNPQQWMGVRAVCNLLNVSVPTLYRAIDAGHLHQYRPETAHALFWRPEVEAYREARNAGN